MTAPTRRSLFQLVSDVPALVRELVKGEIAQLKAELIAKGKKLGIGAGLIVVALVILLFSFGVFLTAAVFGLAYLMPDWLAALVVAILLVIVAAVVGFLGYKQVQKGLPPVPEGTIASVKRDINTIKGMAK